MADIIQFPRKPEREPMSPLGEFLFGVCRALTEGHLRAHRTGVQRVPRADNPSKWVVCPDCHPRPCDCDRDYEPPGVA